VPEKYVLSNRLPKINTDDFQIQILIPQCKGTKNAISRLEAKLHERIQWFVLEIRDNKDFDFGQTRQDLAKLRSKLYQVLLLMRTNPNIFQHFEYKAGAVLSPKTGITPSQWEDFYNFMHKLNHLAKSNSDTMIKILDIYCNAFEQTKGRYKDNMMSHRKNTQIFIAQLMDIYVKATGQKATYAFSINQKPTACQLFIQNIINIIGNRYLRKPIIIDIPNYMARLSKSPKNS